MRCKKCSMLYSLGSSSCELLFVSIPNSLALIETLLEELLVVRVGSELPSNNDYRTRPSLFWVVLPQHQTPVINFFVTTASCVNCFTKLLESSRYILVLWKAWKVFESCGWFKNLRISDGGIDLGYSLVALEHVGVEQPLPPPPPGFGEVLAAQTELLHQIVQGQQGQH